MRIIVSCFLFFRLMYFSCANLVFDSNVLLLLISLSTTSIPAFFISLISSMLSACAVFVSSSSLLSFLLGSEEGVSDSICALEAAAIVAGI